MLPLIYFGMSHYATADTLYWDGTDTTSGNGSPVGGSGNWNTSTNWTSDASGTTNQAWGDGDNAVFGLALALVLACRTNHRCHLAYR